MGFAKDLIVERGALVASDDDVVGVSFADGASLFDCQVAGETDGVFGAVFGGGFVDVWCDGLELYSESF